MEEAKVVDDNRRLRIVAQERQDLGLVQVEALEAHETHGHTYPQALEISHIYLSCSAASKKMRRPLTKLARLCVHRPTHGVVHLFTNSFFRCVPASTDVTLGLYTFSPVGHM